MNPRDEFVTILQFKLEKERDAILSHAQKALKDHNVLLHFFDIFDSVLEQKKFETLLDRFQKIIAPLPQENNEHIIKTRCFVLQQDIINLAICTLLDKDKLADAIKQEFAWQIDFSILQKIDLLNAFVYAVNKQITMASKDRIKQNEEHVSLWLKYIDNNYEVWLKKLLSENNLFDMESFNDCQLKHIEIISLPYEKYIPGYIGTLTNYAYYLPQLLFSYSAQMLKSRVPQEEKIIEMSELEENKDEFFDSQQKQLRN